MKFYSGKGDNGTSTLFGSKNRLAKTNPRFEALGSIDELVSLLGVCRSISKDKKVNNVLKQVQQDLFIIQAEIGAEKLSKLMRKEKVLGLEKTINQFGRKVGEIKKFVIAGGAPLAAHIDFTRALTRSVERRLAAVKKSVNPASLAYINRLSSLLFVLARYVNKKNGIKEDYPAYK